MRAMVEMGYSSLKTFRHFQWVNFGAASNKLWCGILLKAVTSSS